MRKKYLLAIPILFATILGFFISTQEVRAETYPGEKIEESNYISNVYIKKFSTDGRGKYEQARFIRRADDNAFLYCLQPFVAIDHNMVYNVTHNDYLAYLNMSESQWDRVSLLAYYGYGYGNHTSDKWYAVTQVMIWRTIEPNAQIFFTDTLNGTRNDSLFTNEIAELENLVNQHSIKPNFNNGSITLPIGQSITLNDSNGVLGNFKVSGQTNAVASINGNSLTITATNVGNATIKVSKEDSIYGQPPIVYFVEGSQDVLRLGSYDPIFKTIDLKVVGGRVEITKRDKTTGEIIPQGQASLTGAEYGVYDMNDNLITKIKTDNNAYAISDYLPTLGKFYLKEIKPSEGYQLDSQKYYFTVDENNLLVKVNVYEEVITREYEITKVVASDKTQIMTPEVNVVFGIYDHNGTLVSKETTDKEGKIYFTLPYGHYILRQLTSPSGYEKIEDYHFEVKETGSTINKVFSNAEITSRIKVIKVDDEGNVITKAGIKFKIKDLSTGEYVKQTVSYPNVVVYEVFETDENGVLITPYPLNSGTYQLEELDQVIFGYVWNSKPLKFTIDEKANIYKTDQFDAILDIRFTNKEVKGVVEIHKTGEKLVIENNTYTYEEIALPDVVFGLYDEQGNLVQKITTDKNGNAKFENLKLGKYILKELSSSNNNILDETEYEFELKYKDQYTPLISKTFTLKNYLGKGTLNFNKSDLTTGKEIAGVKIQIFTEDDQLIFEGISDENGKIKIDDLFIGKFYIVETDTVEGYKLSDEKVFFEIKANGEIVKANMTNEKIKGDLEFTKTDVAGEPLPNTLIEVHRAEDDEIIFSGRTDELGKIIIKGIEYGKYYLLEKEAPIGYVLNDEKMFFEILEDGEIIKADMINEKITGNLVFAKIDEDGNPLSGVSINVFKSDGTLIGTYITNSEGLVIIENLEYGDYSIKEVATVDGYELSDETIQFSIAEDGADVNVSMVNKKLPQTDMNDYLNYVAISLIGIGSVIFIVASSRKKKRK